MPGPISDSFDPEWGTRSNAEEISDAVLHMYCDVSNVLGHRDPVFILDLVRQQDDRSEKITATFTEWQWRIIRFALERAAESI